LSIEALAEACDFTESAIRGVTSQQWTAPTPCSEWSVRELVNHTISAVGAFAAIASGTNAQDSPDRDYTGDDPGGSFRRFANAALEAWPQALGGMVDIGPEPMPAKIALEMNLLDTLIHGWDIATATGQASELPVNTAEAALKAARAIVTDQFRTFAGFAPATDVNEHTSPTDQLIAFVGRQPRATP
jgi:uncharacterized protein (TIGR03086 family)